eukprot:scaffold992_cov175-Amphora_coffeaeformis.AAC.2
MDGWLTSRNSIIPWLHVANSLATGGLQVRVIVILNCATKVEFSNRRITSSSDCHSELRHKGRLVCLNSCLAMDSESDEQGNKSNSRVTGLVFHI